MKDKRKDELDYREDYREGDICEWCNMNYPKGSWVYYELIVFNKHHKICSDCYDHLKKCD